MYRDKSEIEKIVNDFCNEKNIEKNIFEVSNIALNAEGNIDGRLYNRTNVVNKDCTYVIKYYLKLNLFVIWNYRANKNMSYSLKSINDKLTRGIRYADKGTEFHTRRQYYVYFDRGENLYELLNLIINPI